MNSKCAVALAVAAGFALGGLAVQGLHAQAKPAAYYIAEITVKDRDAYMTEYVPLASKAEPEQYGAMLLVRGGKTITTQGRAPASRVLLLEFPSLDKAEAWWNSPAQKAAQAVGDKYATFRSYLAEGVAQ